MKWLIFGEFAKVVGLKEASVRVEGIGRGTATVRDALDALLERFPELREHVLDDDGEIVDHVHVVHNHVDIYNEPEQLDATVRIGDELALFPQVA